jgi:hypothetical protein
MESPKKMSDDEESLVNVKFIVNENEKKKQW